MASDNPNTSVGLVPPPDINPRREPVLDFPDRDLDAMTPADYEAIGFMAGLEVHQQLLTRSKLFCRCPSGHYVTRCDAEVLRHMRPTLSELGEYDGTALMEFKTHKEIVYLLERGTVCTYEMDDTPPFPIDEEAVKVALEIALLFNLNLVSELHVMRKQYLDGSIPTGFQRTAMLGLAGTIPFRVPALKIDRELRIRQLSLEEDSCREVSDVGHRITFRTDRLGMPLTEVVTEPDFRTPLELQAGGRLIANVTRTSGKVRRGVGAARQDVNVSVAGGRRVEIKGVPHHRGLPALVHIEGFRQLNLLRVKTELERRGVKPETLTIPEGAKAWETSPLVIDASSALRRCEYAPLRDVLDRGEMAAALKLPEFAGLLTRRTQPGVTFANELADRVRVIACLTARPFMIHSDIEGYGLSHVEWRQLRTSLRASPGDSLMVLWGPERDVDTAVREVFIRAREALMGVPAETRQAYADGTNGFERILPGADRMYPDTDTPPLPIPDAWVEEIRVHPAERTWEKEDRYRALGLDAFASARLAAAAWSALFDAIAPAAGEPARRLAFALEKRIPHFRRRKVLDGFPEAERIGAAVRALERGEMRAEAFESAFDRLIENPSNRADAILSAYRATAGDTANLGRAVADVASRAAIMAGKPAEAVMRWAMGEILPPFVGRVSPEDAGARLREALKPLLENTAHVR
jgi:glutamyl-tRNA(Gln) amidotransferase subunit E